MNISCPVRVPCTDSPILNLSSEDPDAFYWGGYYYPQPCRQVLCDPTYYSKDCFGIVYSATSQADADTLAQQASINCQNPVPIPTPDTTCTNEAQTATVYCSNGNPVSFTCPAGTFSAPITGTVDACIAAANAQAMAYAQQQASLLAQTECPALETHCSFSTGSSLTKGTIGTAYAKQLVVSITGFPVAFYVVSGSLPPGLALNTSGTITGTPTHSGTYQFSVMAETSVTSCTKQFEIIVDPPVLSQPPLATRLSSYTYQLVITGVTGSSFSIVSGSLPTGLTMTSSGLISGTPTEVYDPSNVPNVNVPGWPINPRRVKTYALTISTSAGNATITFYYRMAVRIVGQFTLPGGVTPASTPNFSTAIDVISICQDTCGGPTFNVQFTHESICIGIGDIIELNPLTGGLNFDPLNDTWIMTGFAATNECPPYIAMPSGNHISLLGVYNLIGSSFPCPAVTGSFTVS